MKSYFDSSIIAKTYVLEFNSELAIQWIESVDTVIYSHLHAIEVPNAICLKNFRGEISNQQKKNSLQLLNEDLKQGRLQVPKYKLDDAFNLSEKIIKKYTSFLGTRSLDILHVAIAKELDCKHFYSLDTKQRKLAQHLEFQVFPEFTN